MYLVYLCLQPPIFFQMIENSEQLLNIACEFQIEGKAVVIRPLGEGFINDTYSVYVDENKEPSYILQRKNHIIFPDVPAMMDNISRVTEHIRKKCVNPHRSTLTIIPAKDGKLYFKDAEGNFWAVCSFIGGSKSYEKADSPELAYQGGLGLGVFHRQVSDFKEPLAEVIKGFHNISFRFQQWDEAIAADRAGRVASLSEEIGWIESRRTVMTEFREKYENGTFPMRVTHNDTKISNFLFDAADGSLLCAIDLDTMMSGTLLNDVGDALRSYTNTGAEDDNDLDNVNMSMEMFKAYIIGYMSQMKDSLTPSEIEALAFSGIYITYEQVLRFLMDYINGDTYYKIKYPQHNLVRARAQYKLLQSMESQLDQMNEFVRSIR